MKTARYDLVIIGAGPAGIAAALHAKAAGLKILLAERDRPGGCCLNRGCIPLKAFISSAHDRSTSGFSKEHANSVLAQAREARQYQADALEKDFLRAGIEVKRAAIKIVAATCLLISTHEGLEEVIETRAILVATGSSPRFPAIEGLDLPLVHSVEGFFDSCTSIPPSAVIVGAGPAGIEMADALNALGVDVHLIEQEEGILPGWPRLGARRLQDILARRRVEFLCSSRLTGLEQIKDGTSLRLQYQKGDEIKKLQTQALILAAGRKPALKGLFDGELATHSEGMLGPGGHILVDEAQKTALPGLWAAGDVCRPREEKGWKGDDAVRARMEGERAADSIIASLTGVAFKPLPLPPCLRLVHCRPSLALVGDPQIETDTRVEGRAWTSANPAAWIEGDREGFVRLVFDGPQNGYPLCGAEILANRAGELVTSLAIAMEAGFDAERLDALPAPHPGYGELIPRAATRALRQTQSGPTGPGRNTPSGPSPPQDGA